MKRFKSKKTRRNKTNQRGIHFQPPPNLIHKRPFLTGKNLRSKTASPKEEERASAFHEAGHAVFAVYLGWSLHQVTIVPEGDNTGSVRMRMSKLRDCNDWNLNYSRLGRMIPMLMVLLSGREAQRRYKKRGARLAHAEDDYSEAAEYVLNMTSGDSDEADRLIAWVHRRTVNYLDMLWPPISKFAAVLLAKKTIEGRVATKLIKTFIHEGLA